MLPTVPMLPFISSSIEDLDLADICCMSSWFFWSCSSFWFAAPLLQDALELVPVPPDGDFFNFEEPEDF